MTDNNRGLNTLSPAPVVRPSVSEVIADSHIPENDDLSSNEVTEQFIKQLANKAPVFASDVDDAETAADFAAVAQSYQRALNGMMAKHGNGKLDSQIKVYHESLEPFWTMLKIARYEPNAAIAKAEIAGITADVGAFLERQIARAPVNQRAALSNQARTALATLTASLEKLNHGCYAPPAGDAVDTHGTTNPTTMTGMKQPKKAPPKAAMKNAGKNPLNDLDLITRSLRNLHAPTGSQKINAPGLELKDVSGDIQAAIADILLSLPSEKELTAAAGPLQQHQISLLRQNLEPKLATLTNDAAKLVAATKAISAAKTPGIAAKRQQSAELAALALVKDLTGVLVDDLPMLGDYLDPAAPASKTSPKLAHQPSKIDIFKSFAGQAKSLVEKDEGLASRVEQMKFDTHTDTGSEKAHIFGDLMSMISAYGDVTAAARSFHIPTEDAAKTANDSAEDIYGRLPSEPVLLQLAERPDQQKIIKDLLSQVSQKQNLLAAATFDLMSAARADQDASTTVKRLSAARDDAEAKKIHFDSRPLNAAIKTAKENHKVLSTMLATVVKDFNELHGDDLPKLAEYVKAIVDARPKSAAKLSEKVDTFVELYAVGKAVPKLIHSDEYKKSCKRWCDQAMADSTRTTLFIVLSIAMLALLIGALALYAIQAATGVNFVGQAPSYAAVALGQLWQKWRTSDNYQAAIDNDKWAAFNSVGGMAGDAAASVGSSISPGDSSAPATTVVTIAPTAAAPAVATPAPATGPARPL